MRDDLKRALAAIGGKAEPARGSIEVPRTEPHAISRARERYGIELSYVEFLDLARRCQENEGRMASFPDGRSEHALVVGDRVLWIIYEATVLPHRPFGTIITILPSSQGERRTLGDRGQMERRMKRRSQWSPRRRFL